MRTLTQQKDHLGDEVALRALVQRVLERVVDAGAEEGQQPRRVVLRVQLDLLLVELLSAVRVFLEQLVQVLESKKIVCCASFCGNL